MLIVHLDKVSPSFWRTKLIPPFVLIIKGDIYNRFVTKDEVYGIDGEKINLSPSIIRDNRILIVHRLLRRENL